MSVVYDWIKQIILLIMLATILEMLLPNDSFRRYIKMVIGLVLIVALLSPVMKIFNMPVDEILQQIAPPSSEDPIKNSLNNNKKVIDANLNSYIQQQTAVQMKNYVQKELMDQFQLSIKKVVPTIDPESTDSPVVAVSVLLGQAKTGKSDQSARVEPVKEVTVNVTGDENVQPQKKTTSSEYKEVRSFLAKKWGLSQSKISIQMEGDEG
jgi:stage III sporulation protein AF